MNHRMVFSTVGKIVWAEALLLLIPYVVSLIYKEACANALLITVCVAGIIGTLLMRCYLFNRGFSYCFSFLDILVAYRCTSIHYQR